VLWPEGVKRPQCPPPARLRALYVREPDAIARMSEREREPLDEDLAEDRACALVENWEVLRDRPLGERRKVCDDCPVGQGSYPLATPLYGVCMRHLAEQEAGIAAGRDAYTARERAAIVFVKGELSRCIREKVDEGDRQDCLSHRRL
jgi:hypothetical protein